MRHEVDRIATLLVVATLAAACSPRTEVSEGGAESASVFDEPAYLAAADRLTVESMRATVAELADDRYEGRLPGTTGDMLTQAYLAALLEEAGFEPAAPDGRWAQPFELVGIDTTQPGTWTFSSAETSVELTQAEEFILTSGLHEETSSISDAEVVFVGYGMEAPEYDWDDYKGVDLNGKVLLMLNNDPDWDADLFAGETRLYYGRWSYKYESAARQGAAGAIIIHTTPSAGYPWQVVETSWTGERFELPAVHRFQEVLVAPAWATDSPDLPRIESVMHSVSFHSERGAEAPHLTRQRPASLSQAWSHQRATLGTSSH